MNRRRQALPALLLALLVGVPFASPTAAGSDLPPGGTFLDDNGSKFEGAIEAIAAEGITSGCGPTTFCPDGLVTRGQMATFLVRALNLPSTGTDYFTDDEGSVHEANINRLRAGGHHGRLRWLAVLPRWPRHPRPDGDLPGARLPPAFDRHRLLHR